MSTDISQFLDAPDPMKAYLAAPVESPGDASPADDLQSSAEPLETGQSNDPQQTVAPDAVEAKTGTEAPIATDPVPPTQAPPAELPHQDGESEESYRARWERLQAAIQERQAQAEDRRKIEDWNTKFVDLSNRDEEDIPHIGKAIIAEIQQDTINRVRPQIDAARAHSETLEIGMTALVSAIESELDGDTLKRIQAAAAAERAAARSAQEIEHRHAVRAQVRQEMSQTEKTLRDQISALQAQLDAKATSDTKVYETESGGQAAAEEPTDIMSLLRQGPL